VRETKLKTKFKSNGLILTLVFFLCISSFTVSLIIRQNESPRMQNQDENTENVNEIDPKIQDSISNWFWPTPNGIKICTENKQQRYQQIISDGQNGAIIVWQDNRSVDFDIYAQRINSLGDIEWAENGTAICTELGNQERPQLVNDGKGGAITSYHIGPVYLSAFRSGYPGLSMVLNRDPGPPGDAALHY